MGAVNNETAIYSDSVMRDQLTFNPVDQHKRKLGDNQISIEAITMREKVDPAPFHGMSSLRR